MTTRRDAPGKPYSQFPVSNLPCLDTPPPITLLPLGAALPVFLFALTLMSQCQRKCGSVSVSVCATFPQQFHFSYISLRARPNPPQTHTHTHCVHMSLVCVCRVQCCFIFSAKFMNFQPIFSHPALLLNTVSSINWF